MDNLPNEESLLRTHYSDEHIKDGEFTPGAISIRDLKESGYSIDRKQLVTAKIIRTRIAAQIEKVRETNPTLRHTSYISDFTCGDVLNLNLQEGPTFEVFPSPMNGNDAHASIMCTDKGQKDSFYRQARTKLTPILVNFKEAEAMIADLKLPEE